MICIKNITNRNLPIINNMYSYIPAGKTIEINDRDYNSGIKQLERNNCIIVTQKVISPAERERIEEIKVSKQADTAENVESVLDNIEKQLIPTASKKGRNKKINKESE